MTKVTFFAVMAALVLGVCGSASAVTVSEYYNFTTTGSGAYDYAAKTDFTTLDQPWLFVRFMNASVNNTLASLNRWLISKDDGTVTQSLNANKTTNGFWLSLPNWFNDSYWNGSRVGNWTITTDYSYTVSGRCNFTYFGDETHFRVTAVPEPISAGLFLLGGAGLAIFRKRNKA